jgi:uncharacterized protein (TIGR03492 family)
MKLLVISNGYGEDAIGAHVVRRLPSSIEAAAYPTLGAGRAYSKVCPIVGPRRYLPSEGNRTRGSLLRDAASGFGINAALEFMRTEAKQFDGILVVGDMLGVVMCWLTGNRARLYLDVYKSGHANVYTAVERWILRRAAELVLPRDQILAEQLTESGVNARFAGNVMMDALGTGPYDAASRRRNSTAIAVLPGSRTSTPENFAFQMDVLRRVPGIEKVDVFLVLAAGGADLGRIRDAANMRWTPGTGTDGDLGVLSDGVICVHLSTGSLGAVLHACDIVLGQAGTANLQAIGLGRPVITFTSGHSRKVRRQRVSALAGEGRVLLERDAELMAGQVAGLLADPAERRRRGDIGRERIGPPGAIDAIIEELLR